MDKTHLFATHPSTPHSISLFRWKREKVALRDKSEVWAALEAASGRGGGSKGGYTYASFSVNGDSSLTSSLTQCRLPSTLSPPTTLLLRENRPPQQLQRQRLHPGDRPDKKPNQSPPSSRHALHPSVSSFRVTNTSQQQQQQHHQGDNPGRVAANRNLKARLLHTAPSSSLFCGSITDAETGEPLELRNCRWEFPPPNTMRRTRTAVSPGDGIGVKPSFCGDPEGLARSVTTGEDPNLH